MATITLNEALKLRKYDNLRLVSAETDELTTAPNTIHLGEVNLENDFRKFLSLGDANGGILINGTNGELHNIAAISRDTVGLYGDDDLATMLVFDSTKGIFAAPSFEMIGVTLNDVDDTNATVQQIQLNGQTVYQVSYQTGSLGFNANVSAVTWSFLNPNNTFRVIISEATSGLEIYAPTSDADFLAGGGFTIAGSGPQKWKSVVPALWRIGLSYEVKAQSLSPLFNLKGTMSNGEWFPYAKFDGSITDMQNVPTFPLWQPGTWNKDDQIFQLEVNEVRANVPLYRGKILICNTTGDQAGSFADNASKWDSPGAGSGAIVITPEVIKQIKDGLEALKGDDRLDISAIKNVPGKVTDEHIQDVVGASITANNPLHAQYDDVGGKVILSIGTAPIITDFAINTPTSVRVGTDINRAYTYRYSIKGHDLVASVRMIVGNNSFALTKPVADGYIQQPITFTGISTATPGVINMNILINGEVTSNSQIITVRSAAVISESSIHMGPSLSNPDSPIDLEGLASSLEITPGVDKYTLATIPTYSSNQYYVVAAPTDRTITSIKIDGFEQLGGFYHSSSEEINGVPFTVLVSKNQINIAGSSLEVELA